MTDELVRQLRETLVHRSNTIDKLLAQIELLKDMLKRAHYDLFMEEEHG